MADIDLKTATPDTSLPTTGFLFGADSQAASAPSVYSTQTVATTLLGSTSLTGATITTSQPVLDLAQTWNASGVTFTGLRFNATDTASSDTSTLLDLQRNGSPRVQIFKGGDFYWRIAPTGGAFFMDGSDNAYIRLVATSTPSIGFGSGGSIAWRSATTVSAGANDTTISRASAGVVNIASTLRIASNGFISSPAAARIQLGGGDAASPVAQTLSVQSVVAGTSNTAGANLTITGSQGTGTGAGGSIIFQVAPAGTTGTAQNALATALTIGPTGSVTFMDITGGSSFGGTFSVTNGFPGFAHSNGTRVWETNTTGIFYSITGTFVLGGGGATSLNGVFLNRDAANTLALRNANNGQTFRVYGRYTSATDHERFFISAPTTSGDTVLVGTDKGSGGGAARALEFQTDGTTRLTIGTTGIVTVAANTSNSFQVVGSTSGFNGAFFQNTGNTTTSSTGFTAQNNQTALLLTRVYSSAVTASVWGITLGSYSAVFSDGASSEGLLIGTLTADPIIFGTDTSEKMRITSAGLLTFQGTTSSFPALKRSSASLQVRLADDTGYTTIDANHRLQGTAPAANNSTGTAGDIRYDADYIYICTATDTWKRVAIATWP